MGVRKSLPFLDKPPFLSHRLRIGLLVTILVVVLVSSIYAVYYVTLPPGQGPEASLLSPTLGLRLQLDEASFSKGETVNVLISLRNVGNESVTVKWSSYSSELDWTPMYFDFSVVDENGTIIYQWGKTHAWYGSFLVKDLLPGEQLTSHCPWEMRDIDEIPAASGTYFVRALSRKLTLTVGEDSSVVTLETPSIAILIS